MDIRSIRKTNVLSVWSNCSPKRNHKLSVSRGKPDSSGLIRNAIR
jgi:hypothetical protein